MRCSSSFIFICFYLFFTSILYARTIGSTVLPSIESEAFFPKVDSDNKMSGFALFEKGFALEDLMTTCTFDAIFPVSGDFVMNGGTLYLSRNLSIQNPFFLSGGRIDGRGSYSIVFPGNFDELIIPFSGCNKRIDSVLTSDRGEKIYSLDFSHDGKYLAVGLDSGSNELELYYIGEDFIPTLTRTINIPGNDRVRSVRWHPTDYYLAVGKSTGDEFEIYYLNVSAGTFTKTDGVSTNNVNAVSWHPSGDYVALGRSSNDEIILYDVVDGVLGASYSDEYFAGVGKNRSVEYNCLDWDFTGSYLAVGLDSNSSYEEVKIFYFDGVALQEHAEIETGARVRGLGWNPVLPILAIGNSTGTNRLLLYEHDSVGATFSLLDTEASVPRNIYGLNWCGNGCHLIVAVDTSSLTFDIDIHAFDKVNLVLHRIMARRLGHDVRCVAIAPNEFMMATGDYTDELNIFLCSYAKLYFKDVNIFFNSDITFNTCVQCEGNVIIDAGGNTISFIENGSLCLSENANVTLRNGVISGIIENEISCATDTSILTLQDLEFSFDSNYTFSVGSLRFQNTVILSGTNTFVYSSSQTSTILEKSELILDEGLTFSYDSGSQSKNLIQFVDQTSKLILNSATFHTTVTGIELTNGTIIIQDDSTFSSDTQEILYFDGSYSFIDEGITIGNEVELNDCRCIIQGATLTLSQGSLNYKNVSELSWNMLDPSSRLYLYEKTRLNLYQSLSAGSGQFIIGELSTITKSSGKNLLGAVTPLGRYYSGSL